MEGIIWPPEHRVTTGDGAEVAYALVGPAAGPVVALCSGFICADTWWAHLVPQLTGAGYRVVVPHYRGIGPSTVPPGAGPEAFTVPRLAADVVAVLAAEGIGAVALAGHSMGVQVMLEAWDQLRSGGVEVTALAALTGPYASPVRTLYNRALLGFAIYHPLQVAALLSAPAVLRRTWRLGLSHLPIYRAGRLLGVLSERCDEDLVDAYLAHAAQLDAVYVRRVAAGMHGHSAEHLLPEISAPTLVVVGGRDPWSPPALGARMVERMPDAYLRLIPHGTHGTLLEYPELVGGWVLDHLAAHHPVAGVRAAS